MQYDAPGVASGVRPNILLVTTDSQRCNTLACMGNPHAVSPNLDRLASEGTLFTDAYTASPVCTPARCSLMTGVHSQTHGAIENGITPHDHLVTFPTLLGEAGYTTIMVGKLHVGPLSPAYDHECIIAGEKGNDKPDPYTAFLASHGHRRGSTDLGTLPADLHMEEFLVDRTIAAIDEARTADPERPFFAHCSLLSPHDPIDPPAPWDALYDGHELPDINYQPGELDTHPALLHDVFGLRHRTDTDRCFTPSGALNRTAIDAQRRRYYGLAAFCDHQIGRLIDTIDSRGLRESTLVIFTSDHGMQLFDHGFNNKHCWYDASWRVPMIFRMPGTVPADVRRDFASWVDLAPSMLAVAGVECPSMQGLDLFTPLATMAENPRQCAASTLYTSSALVTSRWKLEWYAEEAAGRLYDRANDPDEQVDLFESTEHMGVCGALLRALLEWRSGTLDVQWLQSHTHDGGPVATSVARHTSHLHGDAPERRLNHRMQALTEPEDERLSNA